MIDLEILEKRAVELAINFKWKDAIRLNQEIVKQDDKNIQSYLRLGFAYLQIDDLKNAKVCYQKALKLQPGNQIARQNIKRLEVLEIRGKRKKRRQQINLDPNLFLEVPGKTKSATLVNLGQKDILAQLLTGQEVELKKKKRRIEIRLKSGEYIGCLPDDLSKRLIIFIQAKSRYIAYIKEANLSRVIIFIKEDKKGKKVSNFISFPPNLNAGLDRISASKKNTSPEDEDLEKTSEEEVPEHELEKLAEDLTEKEEIYLPYGSQEEEEEEE